MFRNMKVRTRLAAGFILVLLLMLAVIVVGIVALKSMDDELQTIVVVENARSLLVRAMSDDARELAIAVRDFLLAKYRTEFSESLQVNKDHLVALRRKYAESFARMKTLFSETDAKGIALLNKVEDSDAAARQLHDQVMGLAVAGKHMEATDLVIGESYTAVKQWIQGIDDLEKYQRESILLRFGDAQKLYVLARTVMLMLGVAAIALSGVIIVFLTLSISSCWCVGRSAPRKALNWMRSRP